MTKASFEEFLALANQQLNGALACIPSDPNLRSILLTETLRAVDYETVMHSVLPQEHRLPLPQLDIVHAGWNLAVGHMLATLPIQGAIPMRKASIQSRSYAFQLVHQLGRSVLLRRVADMIKHGFVDAEKTQDGFLVSKADSSGHMQFADLTEPMRLEEQTGALRNGRKTMGPWTKLDAGLGIPKAVGNYFGIEKTPPGEAWIKDEIDSIMIPMIKPFETKHGTFIGYDSSLEIENHFLALVSREARAWQIEAGIHPEIELAGSSGADILGICTLLSAMHRKHIHFVLLAGKHKPSISIPDSFMIWAEQPKLKRGIQEFTGMSEQRVQAALNAITLTPNDSEKLKSETRPCVPLLISMENGLQYYPVSSAYWNPYISIGKLAEWRDPKARDTIAAPRERWLRDEIYAGFQGTRYVCIEGAIKLRDRDRLLTDIDAAILDRTNGELALFQIKWQDYFTNNVRELRSRSANQARDLDEWAEKVSFWFSSASGLDVVQTFRINPREHAPVLKVFLFGISRSFIRTQGYGFLAKHPMLSIGTIAQFSRIRFEIGPVPSVFDKIHEALRLEEDPKMKCTPIPTTILANGKKITFADLWNSTELA